MPHQSEPAAPDRFTGDRYQRLRRAAEVLAEDPAIADSPYPSNGEALTLFVDQLTARRLLDPLSDADCTLVSMLLLLDFAGGPAQAAWRLDEWLPSSAARFTGSRDAVARVFSAALHIVTARLPCGTSRSI